MTDKIKHVDGTGIEAVQHDDGSVDLRDTPGGPALTFSASEWNAFIHGVKGGEFSLPPDDGSSPRE